MKILQVINTQHRRGAEVFATLLSDELSKSHRVLMVSLHKAPPDALLPKITPLHDLEGDTANKLDPFLIWRLAEEIRAFTPDIVQANGSSTLKYTALASLLLGKPCPLFYRNISMASEWTSGPLHRLWVRGLVRVVDYVTSVSMESCKDFVHTYDVSPRYASTIRRGIDTAPADPKAARETLAHLGGVSPDAHFLAHIGSFSPEKNHEWLLHSFREVLNQTPRTHLFLFGDGPLHQEAQSVTRTEGMKDRVHFLGTRADATNLIAGADLLLLPSLIEGIPGVVLEAAAQGVPSVATDVGGLREVIDVEQERGILVPLENRRAFVSAVLTLLRDPERRRRMGEKARTFVREHYDIAKTARAFESLYRQALAEKA